MRASRFSPAVETTSRTGSQSRLGSARTVALTLGIAQACLGAVAIGVVQLGHGSVVIAWTIWFVVATAAIVLLESQVVGSGSGSPSGRSPGRHKQPAGRLGGPAEREHRSRPS